MDSPTSDPKTIDTQSSDTAYFETVDQLIAALTPNGEIPDELVTTIPESAWARLFYLPLPTDKYPETTRRALGRLVMNLQTQGKITTFRADAVIPDAMELCDMQSSPDSFLKQYTAAAQQPASQDEDRYPGVLVHAFPDRLQSPAIPEIDEEFYQPLPPSLADIKKDHAAIKDHLLPKPVVLIDNSPESRQRLITSIINLLKDSSTVEGLGPNGEIIRIERGILEFVEITISVDNGVKNFGCHGISVPRSVDTEILTRFQIDEEGSITEASTSLISAHSSIYSPQIDLQTSPLPLTTDLQTALDAFHLTKQGTPVGFIRKALRTAIVIATEMNPFGDGYNDRFRRENPRPPRHPDIREGL